MSKKLVLATLGLLAFGFSAYGQKTDLFSLMDYEKLDVEEDKKEKTVYTKHTIEELKKSVSPRYIRMLEGEILHKGIFFSYFSMNAESIEICGDFYSWRCRTMERNKYGVFFHILELPIMNEDMKPEKEFHYKFKVDGVYALDPNNELTDEDHDPPLYNYFVLDKSDPNIRAHAHVLSDSLDEEFHLRKVRFEIYNPKAERVTLVGSFNHFDPEFDRLEKTKEGYFVLEKKLMPGEYQYYFMIDGDASIDIYNPVSGYQSNTGDHVSTLVVRPHEVRPEKK
jgi:1,4-alpha-glucan branching enzyme